jgi:Peptidase A4 family
LPIRQSGRQRIFDPAAAALVTRIARKEMTRKLLFGGAALVLAAALGYAPAALTSVIASGPGSESTASSAQLTPQSVVHGPVHPHRNTDGSLQRGLHNQISTGNWSGFAVATFQTSQIYSSASGTWQVPSVSYAPYSGTSTWEYSVNWIGIGGFCQNSSCSSVDQTLIQLGTGQSASNSGGTYYYAWYELLPAGLTVIPLTVRAGDIMTAALQCTAGCSPSTSQTWVLRMSDETAGWTWTETFQYQTGMGSAEWIVEAPSSGGTLPLDDYTLATFETATANGANPNLSLSTNGLIMHDSWGQTSNPSSPVLGQWFSTCWGNGTTLTPCTATDFTVPPPPPPAAPTDTLAANPTTITAGQSSTLSWSSTNATSCTGAGFTASGTSGSAVVSPIATTTYSLTCTGSGGATTASATVHVGSTTCNHKKCNAKVNTASDIGLPGSQN